MSKPKKNHSLVPIPRGFSGIHDLASKLGLEKAIAPLPVTCGPTKIPFTLILKQGALLLLNRRS